MEWDVEFNSDLKLQDYFEVKNEGSIGSLNCDFSPKWDCDQIVTV